MTRSICLSIALAALAAAPGCSSCFGGSSCRRPSFMEFRSPCGRQADPCHAPVCEPACGPACGAPTGGACCEEGGAAMSAPASAPIVTEQGTFS